MSIFAIKQGYIVKSVLLISFVFVISLGLIGGCSDDNNSINAAALTENDFAEDSALRADLEEGVVVTFLEAPNSELPENDTGTLGVDEVPVIFERVTEQTFCWEDDDVDAMHFMELRDSEGSLILTVEVNGDCVTEVIEEGNYVISIHHDERIGDELPIFLIPDPEESEQARKTEGLIYRVNVAAAKILKAIQKTVTKDAQAQEVMRNINTLLSTRSCIGCRLTGANLSSARLNNANLRGAGLSGADLSGANLSGANMSNAHLASADLSGANLSSAVLRFARFPDANLLNANLSGADLSRARFIDSDLRRANFSGAILTDATLTGADMTGARLSGANITNANLSGVQLGVADMSNANLMDANLSGAELRNANSRRANLRNADLTDADFRFVNLTQANLTGVTLSNTDFSFATWCPGTCRCSEDSIDTCVGCTPLGLSAIDFCTGP